MRIDYDPTTPSMSPPQEQESVPGAFNESIGDNEEDSVKSEVIEVQPDQEHARILGNELASVALALEVESPQQLFTHGDLAARWNLSNAKAVKAARLYRAAHPDEAFTRVKGAGPNDSYVYTQEQVTAIEEEAGITPPENSFSVDDLSEKWGKGISTTRNIIHAFKDRHPEEVINSYGQGRGARPMIHLTADQVALLESELTWEAPEGYKNAVDLSEKWGMHSTVVRLKIRQFQDRHPELDIKKFEIKGESRFAIHLSPDQIITLEQEIGITSDEIPQGSKTAKELAIEWKLRYDIVRDDAAKVLRDTYPDEVYHLTRDDDATGPRILTYTPLQQERMKKILNLDRRADGKLKSLNDLAAEWNVEYDAVHQWARNMVKHYPDQELKTYLPPEESIKEMIYLDEAQVVLIEGFKEEAERERLIERDQLEADQENERLRKDLTDYLHSLSEGQSVESQDFQSLISLFGAEQVVDILYQRHPEYRKLPVPYVKSVLADYLGEFLLVRSDFSLDGLEKGAPLLSNASFKDGLTEVIKNDCLRLLNELSRTSPDEANEVAVAEYMEHIRQKTAEFSNPELEEVLGEIEAYYQLLFEDIHKPDCFVDQLDDGRLFPDINQRINVQEIAFKHKILIADEMGMGKSASAIMAKEIIGAKQALIVVPSNVTSVWENYLSDRVGKDGEQIGYFKEGRAPRVLMVNSLEDLTDVSHEDYDYIVISQERLNDKYTDALSEFNYDMLIVDEMHKLKNISSGKRSENLITLAEQIEGEDKYLALLSGTPVPNKIGDVALTLKLLYPERFGDVDNKQLVNQILNGDMLDLRSLLVPRMQMKSLAENVDMPELQEVTRTVELSDQEKEIYDILIEEDELSASEKLVALRQFAMNPRMLDATPDIVGSKPLKVGEALRSTFTQKDKVVMFVNGYIEGVMRGDDTIVQDLNLPQDVEVLTIDGSVSKERRIEIQNQLQSADRKILLIVSGQTADTGVDFSAAEAVYHYNEPWSIYDKQQQTARVYRPGLKSDLTVETFVSEGTIERGIHEYIGSKYQAVEKLLRGVPISEIEKGMLRQAEKQADPDIEVNPELAKYYFSSWDKMMKIYGHVKEVGEEDFRKFLARYDKDYADSYADLAGSRSYQANVGRLSGSLIQEMIQERGQQAAAVRVLDIASGPEVLRQHTVEELAQNVISIDINHQHFNDPKGKKAVGSMVHLPIADKSIDYTNLSLALHYTSFAPSKNNYERLEVLKEVNRVLTVGGRATVSMIYSLSLDNDPVFEETMSRLGLRVVGEYTGEGSGGKNFQTQVITLEKVRDCSSDVRALAKEIGAQGVKALKFRKTDTSLRNSKKVIKSFFLGERTIEAQLNDADQRVLAEEERVTAEMENLKQQFGTIEEIPKSEIYRSGFSRIFNGKRYVLFKRLDTDAGAVVIR